MPQRNESRRVLAHLTTPMLCVVSCFFFGRGTNEGRRAVGVFGGEGLEADVDAVEAGHFDHVGPAAREQAPIVPLVSAVGAARRRKRRRRRRAYHHLHHTKKKEI